MSPEKDWEDKKELITTSLESGIDCILDLEDSENIRKVGNFSIISNEEDADIYLIGIDGEGDGTVELKENLNESYDLNKAKEAKNEGKTVCAYIEITDKLHEQLAVSLGRVVDYIILVGTDWTIIPLENIGDVACCGKDHTKHRQNYDRSVQDGHQLPCILPFMIKKLA